MLTFSGNLTKRVPDETYKLELQEDRRYVIELEGTGPKALADPFLILLGEGGEYIENDNNGNDGAALIEFRPTKTQYYDITALAAAGSLGAYTLTVKVDDYRDTVDGAPRIGQIETDGVTKQGRINEAGDADLFEVRLVKDLHYNLRLDPTLKGLNADGEPKNRVTDPKLTLLSESGKAIASDDNSGQADAAFIDYVATRNGLHYLRAEAADDDTGTYLILASIGRASYQPDEIRGTKASDSISALSGNDKVSGRDGNDRIWGANGNDTLEGGPGNDMIRGGEGKDRIMAGAGHDTLRGENGNDLVVGGADNDQIYGGEGDDTLEGGAGADQIRGEAGANIIRGDEGNDYLYGGDESDTLLGGDDSDRLNGGNGNDTLKGGTGSDYLSGDTGDDFIRGGSDDDYYLSGGDGNDTLKGEAGGDNIYGGNDDDLIRGGADGDYLNGDAGADTLKGGDSRDSIYGGGDADELSGGQGNDHLDGGNGADRLDGGSGADDYSGGGGNDIFVFSKAGHSTSKLMDGIYRFDRPGDKAGDVIDLSAIDGDRTTVGRQALVFDDSGSGNTGTLWLENSTEQSDSSIFIYANLDQDDEAEMVIRLYNREGSNASQYSEHDFVF